MHITRLRVALKAFQRSRRVTQSTQNSWHMIFSEGMFERHRVTARGILRILTLGKSPDCLMPRETYNSLFCIVRYQNFENL